MNLLIRRGQTMPWAQLKSVSSRKSILTPATQPFMKYSNEPSRIVSFLGATLPAIRTNPLLGQVPSTLSQIQMPMGLYIVPQRDYKIQARPNRRCKDCQLVFIEGLLHNICKTHGRHKQRQKPPYFTNMRIMTSVSTVPKKPW